MENYNNIWDNIPDFVGKELRAKYLDTVLAIQNIMRRLEAIEKRAINGMFVQKDLDQIELLIKEVDLLEANWIDQIEAARIDVEKFLDSRKIVYTPLFNIEHERLVNKFDINESVLDHMIGYALHSELLANYNLDICPVCDIKKPRAA